LLNAALIEGFVGSVLAKKFDEATAIPQLHKELWELASSTAQYVAIAAPRGHAKSTAGTLAYTLASLLFRESTFALIVSDTESQACMFLGAIKQELSENEDIIELFGIKKNEKGEVSFLKDAEADVIVECNDGHKFRVIAKGAEQKLRGLNWNGTRPNLVVVDDLENDELVMNKERRSKLRRWFFGALLPAMSPRGKLRMWGTILHMDSLLESLMPSYTAKETVFDGLKMYTLSTRGMWRTIKYKAHNEDMTEFLWPERFNQDYFVAKREEYTRQGIADVYSQEYLNYPIDDTVAYFKKHDLLPITEEDRKLPLRYYITADLAISEKETADYTVFMVGGVDEYRRLHIKEVIRERLDGREIVDTLFALENTYHPEAFGIEEMQISKAIGPFLREEMIRQNVFPHIVLMSHMNKDKLMRARSIQGRVRARSVKIDKEADWYPVFEDELTKFPRTRNDDQVDTFAYLGLLLDRMIEAPTTYEQQEEEYQDELRNSGFTGTGRSRITGY
jgi:predicted phage terminase large subunit-like protein